MKKISIFLMMLCLACFGVANAQTVVYSEGFENMSSASDLTTAGWISWGASGGFIDIETSYVNTGSHALNIDAWSCNNAADSEVAGLPILSNPINTLQITFAYRQRSGGTVKVGYLTDPDDASSFVELESLDKSTSGYSTVTVDLSAAPATAARIAIEQYTWYECYIDDIEVSTLPSCITPKNLTVTPFGTSAVVSWTSNATNFNIELDGIVTPATSNPDTISGLQVSTTYIVKVQTDCGGGEVSEWTDGVSFTTLPCSDNDMCEIQYELSDSYGDGWNGNSIQVVDVLTNTVLDTWTISGSGYSASGTLAVCDGREIEIQYVLGSGSTYPSENSFVITDHLGEVIWEVAECSSSTGSVTHTVDCTVPSCLKPTDLAATDITNESAVITWTAGGANQTSWNLKYKKTSEEKWKTVNGLTVATDTITGLVAGTEYEVQVQGNCGTDGLSDWTDAITFTTALCALENMCELSYVCESNYQSWYGAAINVVDEASGVILATWTQNSTTGTTTGTLAVCDGRELSFEWVTGSYDSYSGVIAGFAVYDAEGTEILSGTSALTSAFRYTVNCPTCFKPTNLHATDVTTESAKLNWDGTSASYALKYRTAEQNINLVEWHQIGEDVTATATETTYNFDLSDYSGAGYVAIRHYNVTNMFYLDVDNVTVTDPDGTTVLVSADGTSIPSDWTNQDVDGDGYVWSTSLISGYFVSQSYDNNAGPLNPDNWLIIPVSNLGGTLSFTAKGQDSSFPSEIFGVFVTTATLTDALQTIAAGSWSNEFTTTDNFYPISGLTANTPYEWQVKGVCGTDDESTWVTSTFSTIALGVKNFVTEGNWNVANNWSPAGVPTIDDKVMISANATIPAGVVATAKKITLNGGTLTIADGGQLKQNGNVELIMEKEIAGYGTGNGNWYFIASPLTTTRLNFVQDWSFVNALTGNYDLYAFDPTQTLEWINYRSNSSHAAFTSGNNSNVLVSKTGYLYGHEDYIKLQFEGSTAVKSNDNVETLDLTLDGTSTDDFNGFTLVGNPFTCNTYITFVDASNNVLAADYYVMNTNGDGFDIQASNIALAPCTGAIIDYSQVGSGTVQFNTEAPTGSKSSALNMNVTNGSGKVDMARVRFGEGSNLRKMSFRENNSKLYMSQNGEDFAVVYADQQGEMPVSFKAAENGTYTISFSTENVEFGYLHLIDNMTGNDVDLLANPSYTFNANATDYASRFRLVFAAGNDDNNFAFVNNGEIILNGHGTVQVYDVTGRMISSHNDVTSIATDGMSAGVYMLRLINGSDIKTQKIVVK